MREKNLLGDPKIVKSTLKKPKDLILND